MKPVIRPLLQLTPLFLLCSSILLEAKPASSTKDAKSRKAPAAMQKEGDAPAAPAAVTRDSASGVPLPSANDTSSALDALAASIPTSGPLSERQLTILAIANNPELEKLRNEIRVAHAEKAAAHDWENPELRIGYGWQNDESLSNPYTERRTERTNSSESFSQFDTTSVFGSTGSITDRESGSSNESRYRTVERRVTPGRYQDRIVSTTYEDRSSSGSSSRSSTSSFNPENPLRESRGEGGDRRIVSRSTETINHPDAFSRDESLSILLRFQPPHPWQRKAIIERAIAEISLAEAKYLVEEDKVVQEVRELYSKLSLTKSELAAERKRKTIQENLKKELLSFNFDSSARIDAGRASLAAGKAVLKATELSSEAGTIQVRLAGLCGVSDASRIAPSGMTIRRVLDGDRLSASYLADMAMVYRADILESKARMAVASALLKEQRAAAIPFATFLDAGWGRQWTEGRGGSQDEWMIRVGVSLPFFEWAGINKKKKVYEVEERGWAQQIEKQRQQITAQITMLLNNLSAAGRELADMDKELQRIRAEAASTATITQVDTALPDVPGINLDSGNANKSKRFEFELQDLEQEMEIGRYQNWRDYNDTLLQLENAIGVRLEKILPSSRGSK